MGNSSKSKANQKVKGMVDPGMLPLLASPLPGDVIEIQVGEEPPIKDIHFSIRNPRHKKHFTFKRLRQQAIKSMAGRKWYDGPVKIDLTLSGPSLEKSLYDYIAGISDSLDGSHGDTFTYLPIIYQDDCQITDFIATFKKSSVWKYELKVTFL